MVADLLSIVHQPLRRQLDAVALPIYTAPRGQASDSVEEDETIAVLDKALPARGGSNSSHQVADDSKGVVQPVSERTPNGRITGLIPPGGGTLGFSSIESCEPLFSSGISTKRRGQSSSPVARE